VNTLEVSRRAPFFPTHSSEFQTPSGGILLFLITRAILSIILRQSSGVGLVVFNVCGEGSWGGKKGGKWGGGVLKAVAHKKKKK
jgi:hypothetical protein